MPYKLDIRKVDVEKIELTEEQAKEITLRYLGDKFNFRVPVGLQDYGYYGCKIKDGKVIESYEEYYGRHSSTETKELRDATDSDYYIEKVLRIIRGKEDNG